MLLQEVPHEPHSIFVRVFHIHITCFYFQLSGKPDPASPPFSRHETGPGKPGHSDRTLSKKSRLCPGTFHAPQPFECIYFWKPVQPALQHCRQSSEPVCHGTYPASNQKTPVYLVRQCPGRDLSQSGTALVCFLFCRFPIHPLVCPHSLFQRPVNRNFDWLARRPGDTENDVMINRYTCFFLLFSNNIQQF